MKNCSFSKTKKYRKKNSSNNKEDFKEFFGDEDFSEYEYLFSDEF